MLALPHGDGIFAFSDTAGANACLSIAYIMQKEWGELPLIFTNNENFLHNSWGLPVHYISEAPLIDAKKFRYVFTGTSHPESSGGFELGFIEMAQENGLYSIAFIDHWVTFLLRFEKQGKLILPDEIWVIDEVARQKAMQEGLPGNRLLIKSNPFHLYLSKFWQTGFRKKSYLQELGIGSTEKRVIVFAPDPVSLRFSMQEIGFSEAIAIKILLKVLSEVAKEPILLLIKLHPLQPKGIIEQQIVHNMASPNVEVYILEKANNLELISVADCVIGFYSNFLIESQRLGKPVIRYFPGNQDLDPMQHLTIGSLVINEEQLFLALNDII
jgi:hypothetical protein